MVLHPKLIHHARCMLLAAFLILFKLIACYFGKLGKSSQVFTLIDVGLLTCFLMVLGMSIWPLEDPMSPASVSVLVAAGSEAVHLACVIFYAAVEMSIRQDMESWHVVAESTWTVLLFTSFQFLSFLLHITLVVYTFLFCPIRDHRMRKGLL